MSSPIEIFETIFEHRSIIDDINESYYYIAASAYESWIHHQLNTIEHHLAKKLSHIMIDILVDTIKDNYSSTKYHENRLVYHDYFVKSIRDYRKCHTDNRLIQTAIEYIDLNIIKYM